MRYRKRSKSPIIFQQRMGDIFGDHMTVVVGGTHKDVLAFAKKHKYRKDLLKYIQETPEYVCLHNGDRGHFAYNSDIRALFLVLEPYDDCWPYWEVLIHELNHAVFRFAQIKGMAQETEVQARLQEFLFREIRRKLQGYQRI